ncbi:MAG: hypothetical protein WCO98_06575 [bacterium]
MNEFKVVLCPVCGKENHINAESEIDDATCEFCHAQLQPGSEQPVVSLTAPPKSVDPKTLPYSSMRPFWYVALMMMMTIGLYRIVWLYRSWQILNQHYKLKNNIIFNIWFDPFFSFRFFKYAFFLGKECGYKPFMPTIIYPILYFIFLISVAVSSRISGNEMDWYEIGMVVSLALLLIPIHGAVKAINAGHTVIEPDTQMRTKLSAWSIVFVCLGSLFWLGFTLSCLEYFHVIDKI